MWQPHHEFASLLRAIASCLDRAAVERNDALDQREAQSQTAAGSVVSRRDLREPIEDPGQEVRGNTDAVVLYA